MSIPDRELRQIEQAPAEQRAMSDAVSVQIETTYGAAKKIIAAGLESFNREHMHGRSPKAFAATANVDGAVRGGLMAEAIGEWMHISLLWVDEQFRRSGLGTALLKRAETEARSRGARGVLVDTFSFQAPAFYKMHGYFAYGQIEDCPEVGMTWFRFRKVL
ncbi:Acetyltransferase (GNAT) family protein [Bosea sp. 62]|uniref:GNAT family N-acetyltransferase n=1 Tax=unclassified Bosea (in: a-proteobacteria) TaxID=2653178 RepID=UPI001254EDE9|nr:MULTISPECIES: GNAT family N-acetyltransferase [unclassified Bosea (in: a-proteobacteria)]CAD5252424.1 Acetyltransferase (GNAT) family protein [Bosea sp. 7B]CAD5279026.1 Acetyltransferase (GNAT) family protein [Bosea sp. 21B]CAD5280150.1 Acetyltransferase (GNAT) family protein [Bosea sp. 46]VVT59586.1 Acetyltransferase EC 231 [Bosea sp. EC-HK365B]VXB35058.1 Acetyltransferase (GNAT) family protein [Bosea sp. 62]